MARLANLVIVTDHSPESARSIARGLSLALQSGARSTIVHFVNETIPHLHRDSDAAEIAIRNQIHSFPGINPSDVAVRIFSGNAYEEIGRIARERVADLIVLGAQNADPTKNVFGRTTIDRIIESCDLPCLIVKSPSDGAYRRVVLAVGLSFPSQQAIECALRFVSDGDVYLVHGWHLPFEGFQWGKDAHQQFREEHAERLQQVDRLLAACAAGLGRRLTIHQLLCDGPVFDVVRDEVKRLKPDLLVIGVRNRTGIARTVLGSLAVDIVRTSPSDVLLVRR